MFPIGGFVPTEQRIAQGALNEQNEIRARGGSAGEADEVCLQAVKDIQVQSADATATTLAAIAEKTYKRLQPQPDSAAPCADVLRSCLMVVAQPITSPVGIALARVGATALTESDIGINAPSACTIGLTFTHAINDLSTDWDEKGRASQTISQYAAMAPQPNSAPLCADLLKNFLVADASRS
ncbi:MAG: hypothetical protein ACYCW6_27830 [Candidatus Xenobia bacterium]